MEDDECIRDVVRSTETLMDGKFMQPIMIIRRQATKLLKLQSLHIMLAVLLLLFN